MELRCHKGEGTLEAPKTPKSNEQSSLGLSLSSSTPLFKKKMFGESQRDSRDSRDPESSESLSVKQETQENHKIFEIQEMYENPESHQL